MKKVHVSRRPLPFWMPAALAAAGLMLGGLLQVLFAQTVLPTSYQFTFYTVASPTVVATHAAAPSTYACAQNPSSPLPSGRYVAIWDDPATPTLDCRFPDTGTGPFATRTANVTYDVTLRGCVVVDGAVECGPETPRVRFTNRVLPGVPGGFGVVPGVASIQGTLGPIAEDWALPNTGIVLVTFNSPLGSFHMRAGTNGTGVLSLPGYGEVRPGDEYQLNLLKPIR